MPSTPAPIDQTAAKKSAMRKHIGGLRDTMDAVARANETALCHQQVLASTEYKEAGHLLCTLAFGSEIDTRPLIADALSRGKRVALPRVDPLSKNLRLFSIDADSVFERSKWGIDEPLLTAPPVAVGELDFVLVPGLAFDAHGNRLGYGRGYYDRLLGALSPGATRMAMAFTCQIVAVVPTSPTDEKIDRLVTAASTTRFTHAKPATHAAGPTSSDR